MVQYIRPGKRQEGEPPKKAASQPSLFGNGQSPKLGGLHNTATGGPRDLKEEERRAREKFAQTSAGKNSVKVSIQPDAGDPYYQTPKAQAPKKIFAPPCHHSHPPYPVAEGFVIYGGSGIDPHVKDCDVYVSFDAGRYPKKKSWPWEQGEDFVFEIKNYGVPNDPMAFRQLVGWLAEQVKSGRKVHVGCMAGHGRTGMVLAALRQYMTGDKDAIQHVRANYCDQVVETDQQVKWLMQHWGVSDAGPRVKRFVGEAANTKPVTYGFQADDLIDMNAPVERPPAQNSWAANSPWYTPVEGPVADLGDTAWYKEEDVL